MAIQREMFFCSLDSAALNLEVAAGCYSHSSFWVRSLLVRLEDFFPSFIRWVSSGPADVCAGHQKVLKAAQDSAVLFCISDKSIYINLCLRFLRAHQNDWMYCTHPTWENSGYGWQNVKFL